MKPKWQKALLYFFTLPLIGCGILPFTNHWTLTNHLANQRDDERVFCTFSRRLGFQIIGNKNNGQFTLQWIRVQYCRGCVEMPEHKVCEKYCS